MYDVFEPYVSLLAINGLETCYYVRYGGGHVNTFTNEIQAWY